MLCVRNSAVKREGLSIGQCSAVFFPKGLHKLIVLSLLLFPSHCIKPNFLRDAEALKELLTVSCISFPSTAGAWHSLCLRENLLDYRLLKCSVINRQQHIKLHNGQLLYLISLCQQLQSQCRPPVTSNELLTSTPLWQKFPNTSVKLVSMVLLPIGPGGVGIYFQRHLIWSHLCPGVLS